MGGRKADGTFTGATWAYDGSSWARISESMPAAEGYAVTQYPICETDTMSWRLKISDVLIAFGGKNGAGVVGRDVYVSRDMGMTWKKVVKPYSFLNTCRRFTMPMWWCSLRR